MTELLWVKLFFVSKGFITRRDISYSNGLLRRLRQIGALFHSPEIATINAAITSEPNIDILEPFMEDDIVVDVMCMRKTIYLPAPYVIILLGGDLAPV